MVLLAVELWVVTVKATRELQSPFARKIVLDPFLFFEARLEGIEDVRELALLYLHLIRKREEQTP